jgi:plasmid segregation protein ParM
MLIAIDHGNYSIKTENDSFIAGLAEHSVQPPLAADIIEIGGRFWTLTGTRLVHIRDKSRNDNYLILTLFAIARELQAQGSPPAHAEIDLAAGLPPEHYSVLKEKFSKYLRRASVKFAYNGVPMSLNIRHTFIYPQAYAAVAPRSNQLSRASRIFVIDIGGYTTDVLLLRFGKLDSKFCRSLETGVITMNNNIIGKVSALHDMKIEDEHIIAVIQGQETILPDDAVKTILESAESHANTILDNLRELQVDLRSNPVIFVGGGAALFKPYIENSPMVAQADFVPDPKANAIGYGMLASAQLKKAENRENA